MSNVSQVLEIGDVVQQDVITADDVLLLKRGTIITQNLLNGLNRFDCDFKKMDIVVKRNGTVTQTSTSMSPQQRMVSRAEEPDSVVFSEKLKQDAVQAAKQLFANDSGIQEAQNNAVCISNDIADHVMAAGNDARLCIQDLRVADEYTYQHSIDVGVLAAQISKSIGMPKSMIVEAAQAGVLHDIGKRRIPLEILNKPGKLTKEEFEVIKFHPTYAKEDLDEMSNLSEAVVYGAYEHHERQDGSGYPRGLKGKDISPIAQILAIADVYDALTSKRVYKDSMSSAHAVGTMSGCISGFNREYFAAFIRCIILYPTGSKVLCTDGKEYEVLHQNPESPLRPVLLDGSRKVIVDLSLDENKDLSIFGESCDEMRLKFITIMGKR